MRILESKTRLQLATIKLFQTVSLGKTFVESRKISQKSFSNQNDRHSIADEKCQKLLYPSLLEIYHRS